VGFRHAESGGRRIRISDCGFRIEDFVIRLVVMQKKVPFSKREIRNPKSEIRNS
jgi:hypothetical protein